MATTKLESNRGFALIENGASAITNTTAESSLFSAVIKGGQMSTNKIARFEVTCHITTPALSIPALTIRVKLGSASLVVSSGALSISINDKPIVIAGVIANMNATNVQFARVRLDNNSGGTNLFSALGATNTVTDATWAVDTTIDQTLSVTAQFGALSSSTSIVTKLVDLNLS